MADPVPAPAAQPQDAPVLGADAPEQLPGEPAAAYAAFTAYLGLGIGRSLVALQSQLNNAKSDRQGARKPPRQAGGNLRTWAKRYDWPRRAAQFDGRLVASATREAVALMVLALRGVARRVVDALDKPDIVPRTMPEILDALGTLRSMVDQGMVNVLLEDAAPQSDPVPEPPLSLPAPQGQPAEAEWEPASYPAPASPAPLLGGSGPNGT